jgi:hypothetical protein
MLDDVVPDGCTIADGILKALVWLSDTDGTLIEPITSAVRAVHCDLAL